VHGAADPGKKRKGVDRFRREHASIPTETPPISRRLDRARGDALELVGVEDDGQERSAESIDEAVSIWLDAL
jgi:hypothetical protein